ncbi:hypothetical protein [Chamaesiphon sp. OTE_75_metabat_556]|uniref:hypothetical protein n=1 Tax=Chamaesiphon sp. OTE_75_metabat_556 TaxID=2964692 RepID=UPI00286A5C12|nr:hypothetical protein [Chamaesiphon sp. OTE_75_metabat_556]
MVRFYHDNSIDFKKSPPRRGAQRAGWVKSPLPTNNLPTVSDRSTDKSRSGNVVVVGDSINTDGSFWVEGVKRGSTHPALRAPLLGGDFQAIVIFIS